KNILSLPGHYKVYPGHGPDSTITHEKVFNQFFNGNN
ncbi:MBL fold metallo-hydrolase, partial [Streptococcus pyogenes]